MSCHHRHTELPGLRRGHNQNCVADQRKQGKGLDFLEGNLAIFVDYQAPRCVSSWEPLRKWCLVLLTHSSRDTDKASLDSSINRPHFAEWTHFQDHQEVSGNFDSFLLAKRLQVIFSTERIQTIHPGRHTFPACFRVAKNADWRRP